jgi:hypothetical protein
VLVREIRCSTTGPRGARVSLPSDTNVYRILPGDTRTKQQIDKLAGAWSPSDRQAADTDEQRGGQVLVSPDRVIITLGKGGLIDPHHLPYQGYKRAGTAIELHGPLLFRLHAAHRLCRQGQTLHCGRRLLCVPRRPQRQHWGHKPPRHAGYVHAAAAGNPSLDRSQWWAGKAPARRLLDHVRPRPVGDRLSEVQVILTAAERQKLLEWCRDFHRSRGDLQGRRHPPGCAAPRV